MYAYITIGCLILAVVTVRCLLNILDDSSVYNILFSVSWLEPDRALQGLSFLRLFEIIAVVDHYDARK